MYNKELIEKLVSCIQQHDGTADKRLLSAMVQDAFHLERSLGQCTSVLTLP